MKVNDFFDKVAVINLDHRTDRLEKVTGELESLGIKFERISAIKHENPVLGCKLSHIKAWESSVGRTLLLEDDATFMPNFNENFTKFIEALPSDRDMFYLGAYQVNVEPCNELMVRALDTSSTHAYTIHPDKVQAMIQVAKDSKEHVDVAFRMQHRSMRAYAALPTLVKQAPSYSDILGEDVDYTSWYK